jgi:ferredoxin
MTMTSQEELMTEAIRADREACCGNGMCAALAPEIFGLDDDGIVTVLDPAVTGQNEQLVGEVVASCPTAAITVERVPA